MLECSNIMAAIFLCIGAHYIFNLNYHPKSGTLIAIIVQGRIIILLVILYRRCLGVDPGKDSWDLFEVWIET